MLISYKRGQSGITLRVKILDATKSDGSGIVGLGANATGLTISTIADNESIPIKYQAVSGEIEAIATLGVYQAPSSGKCRFGEVHASFHKGIYEIQIAEARFAVPNSKSVLISISGAANAVESDALIPLTVVDPYAINGGFDPWSAALPGGYLTGTAGYRLGYLDATISSRLAQSSYVVAPTGASIAAAVWDESASVHTSPGSFGSRVDSAISSRLASSGYSNPPSASTIATAVWDEAAAVHTVSGSFGSRLDGSISSRLASSAYVSPPTPASFAAAVWDEPASSHNISGSFGSRVDSPVSSRLANSAYISPPNAAAIAAAVWDESAVTHNLAGSFGSRVDSAISTRLAASSYQSPLQASVVASAVWDIQAADHSVSGSFGARLDAAISTRSTFSGGPVASVVEPVVVGLNQDKQGYLLAASGLDAINVEAGINVRQALSPMLAALAGAVNGAGTGSVQIMGGNSATPRIIATTDSAGNRTAVSLQFPA
jgi:hypothetical protein